MLVALRFDHELIKLALCYHKHKRVSLPLVKIAIFSQKWEENHFFRHKNISAPIDDIHGLKAVDKQLLGVSTKIEKTKIIREIEFFNITGLIVTDILESLLQLTTPYSRSR